MVVIHRHDAAVSSATSVPAPPIAIPSVAVAVFHAGVNAMGVFHPADPGAFNPNGVPDSWLNLLAEVTGAALLVLIAILLIDVYGGDRLANRDPPAPRDAGLPRGGESDDSGRAPTQRWTPFTESQGERHGA